MQERERVRVFVCVCVLRVYDRSSVCLRVFVYKCCRQIGMC